METEKKDKKLS